ncbi:MAG TPA: gephyrin-like molybdotransferase Glp [Gemmatimonadaceae bacterium]
MDVGAACRMVLADVSPLAPESVALREAAGRVLAEDVLSPLALPPWDNSSMDGYAVRADDVRGATREQPKSLRVVATVAAGAATDRAVSAGEAIRIMTGGPVPRGADSVIRIEDTDGGTSVVHVNADRDCGRNVRPRGEDLAKDALALPRGALLGAGHVGVLASIGKSQVQVYRRARVAVLASGDELVDVERFDEVLAGKKIVTSNSHSVAAAVIEAGAAPVSLGTVSDDPAALRERLAGLACDLLITTGGVSVGAFDFTRPVLGELGLEQRFWRVRMRPGGPVGFGLLRGIPWLGLPGNPVSTLVTFELFARPAIRRMHGLAAPFRRTTPVMLTEAVSGGGGLTHFVRAVVTRRDAELTARLTGPQGSGLLTSMARADALLIVPADRDRVEAGETLQALLLRDESIPSGAAPA